MERLKIAVLASGSGSNLQAIIDEIKSGFLPVELALVLSDKPQAYALQRAEAAGVPTKVLLPADFASREDYDAELVRLLKASGAEAVALAGYMRLVTPVFLQAFPHRVLNIHPALLPSFPGLHGQRQAFEYGVKVAGCTVHFVDEGMDTGPIIMQKAVEVHEDDTPETLQRRVMENAEWVILPWCINLIASGQVKVENGKVTVAE